MTTVANIKMFVHYHDGFTYKRLLETRPDCVYIGRYNRTYNLPASPFANPFPINAQNTRERVIELYQVWIGMQPQLIQQARTELQGKTLLCWCHPLPCHGDVLAEIADEFMNVTGLPSKFT